MAGTRYRRGLNYAADMAAYARLMSEDNSRQMQCLRRNVMRAIREEVTERQRQMLLMYYAQNMKMAEIAAELGVERSTVSRTIKRGEARLKRCLRYGAARLLSEEE